MTKARDTIPNKFQFLYLFLKFLEDCGTEACPKTDTGCLKKLTLSNFVAPHDAKINSFRSLNLHFFSS